MSLYRLRGLVLGAVFLFVWTVDWLLRCLDGLKQWLDQLIFDYKRSTVNGCLVESLHVAIICEDLEPKNGSSELGVETLARVCCWCSEEGAKLITLYDGSGGLAELSGAISDSVKRQTASEHVKIEVCNWKAKLPKDSSNMITTSVRIITPDFGRGALVNYTRALAGNGSLSKGKISFQDVVKTLDEDPLQILLETEPDLLLLFAESRTLGAFPPWQIRLTQIKHFRSLAEMTRSKLRYALMKALTSEKRFGR
ncbi:hypothetical protein NDN08_006219 [Rhodosorus marinus]|uniref:ditrans,polycis-polyprenyl diphosphate synthase [(2E,6E)-farnesyldiphosphate specific] n=1 Tax=Rhodosorus marinus TaxID=101924 RepID=A0AAV8UK63_9RHOD|nr:hypothetical protein NDN08_006219 [Rhodosorus marinus]